LLDLKLLTQSRWREVRVTRMTLPSAQVSTYNWFIHLRSQVTPAPCHYPTRDTTPMNDWRAHLTAMLTRNTRAGTGTNTDHSAPGLYRTFALQGIAIFMIYIIFRCRGTWSSRKPSSGPKGHEVTASKDVTASDANKHRDPGSGCTLFLGGLMISVITACHVSLAWTPEKFDYPEITPCTDALVDIKPILYRPFRWGEYQCVPLFFSFMQGWNLVEGTLRR